MNSKFLIIYLSFAVRNRKFLSDFVTKILVVVINPKEKFINMKRIQNILIRIKVKLIYKLNSN